MSWTITYEPGANGTIDGTTPQTVENGQNGSLVTAVANPGYQFVEWAEDHNTSDDRTETNVTGNLTFTATFEKITYTLTFDVNDALGGTVDDTTQDVLYLESATEVTATANPNYSFVNWTNSLNSSTVGTAAITVANVAAEATYTANFTIDQHVVSFDTDGNGTLDDDADQTIDYGEPIDPVTATPDPGYDFVNWTNSADGNAPLGTSTTLTIPSVTDDIEAMANFTKHTYILKFVSNNTSLGTLNGDTYQSVLFEASASEVTADPAENCHFINWTDSNDVEAGDDLALTITADSDDTNDTYTANFALDTKQVIFKCSNGGTLSGDTDQIVNYGSDCTAVTATPSAGYRFIKWVNKNGSDKQTGAILTATAITEVKEYTALFSKDVYVCVGTTYDFNVTVPFDADTLNEADLNWAVSGTTGGSITATGIFTPGAPGNVVVTASDKGTGSIHSYYTVTVGSMPKYDRPFNAIILKR